MKSKDGLFQSLRRQTSPGLSLHGQRLLGHVPRGASAIYNLLFPEVSAEILEGLVHASEQSGWLPEWASPGHCDCMIGNH